jgi:hypothetical protein
MSSPTLTTRPSQTSRSRSLRLPIVTSRDRVTQNRAFARSTDSTTRTGASTTNLTFVVPDESVNDAVRELHGTFSGTGGAMHGA